MTTEAVVEVPIVVPAEVLVPTGEIEGMVVAEAAEPENDTVTKVIDLPKKKRGRPKMVRVADPATGVERKMGDAFWKIADPSALASYLESQFNGLPLALVSKVLHQGYGVVHQHSRAGVPQKPREEVEKFAVEQGGRLYFRNSSMSRYVWRDTDLVLTFTGGIAGKIYINTCDASVHDYWEKFSQEWLKMPEPRTYRPQIHSFIRTRNGVNVVSVGELNDTFTAENYPESVVEDYKFICAQFKAHEPVGRLALLEGVPGTGKTRLIRAMICELQNDANCILVAPNVLEHLSGVEFLQSLIQQHHQGRPIVLILEDADACLINRDEDKASLDALTGLLNMSDGILGSTLDIRIIATTNAKIEKLDPAVTRPGRLIRRVEMGPLTKERAEAVFTRLTSKTQNFDTGATIATVYAAAAVVGDLEKAARDAQYEAEAAARKAAEDAEDALMVDD